jgi:small redox-active disulfide protein 2
MLSIKVLGPGCVNCDNVEAIAKRVVAMLSVDATIAKVTDPAAWRKYGLLYTPGLVVNEKLVCAGRIPSEAEVTTWITSALV